MLRCRDEQGVGAAARSGRTLRALAFASIVLLTMTLLLTASVFRQTQALDRNVNITSGIVNANVRTVGQVQRELQVAREQMQQLESYAHEAQQRWIGRSGAAGGVDAAWLHHHRQFMQKIDHAIEFQRSVLEQREALVERSQAQVYATERDLGGLRKYTERHHQALALRHVRQEQKNTDEMALTIHLRQRLAQTQGLRT
jgi:flagellar FliJ protein